MEGIIELKGEDGKITGILVLSKGSKSVEQIVKGINELNKNIKIDGSVQYVYGYEVKRIIGEQ